MRRSRAAQADPLKVGSTALESLSESDLDLSEHLTATNQRFALAAGL
tara:strand:- start:190 stop:330 length:141 start_codon:yes stop_codon:yes gene_type:complete